MPAIQIAGRDLLFNPGGFLTDFDAWDQDIATALAADEGLTLTKAHWTVITFLREYFQIHGFAPPARLLLREIGSQINRYGSPGLQRDLKALFPNGGCKQACRLAGLPSFFSHSC
ncbi:TusE/DsrC/DsvC family sulfur relay protein [Thioalkalicoccus limnaeus]|uniref:Sulfurtransferase n=1 Tax=Thioalkalicoccus limnaeus TaxID=120681 RepID=A0ABV4BC11_9GAMM